ncbi:bifunctional diaminohydroxyphosphoribosylaminopyrimidine deaminase/5-amino-6-(5-phosphoribosylamino)uracil reductase RibD [Marivivens niveibacter]|nr:bifunctional diaminohydroxyphosphoribosylaminopyrimidine deaminase/5-amino-6-(5-phosphoribosylamino)uracil reductase RibD [Marivivens niveibacter]
MNFTASDERYMRLALSLGRRGMGRVWPNPAVGCVIVQGDIIVGRGRTADGGRPHAEPVALGQAEDRARGATAYVTLEPCAHFGKTPPCANALIEAGVARVVIACTDPDPRVSGQGIAMLRAAGITVDVGLCEAEAQRDHAGFFGRITNNRPWVTLKLACTLDGRIATATGESQWITGPEARRMVHAQRARHDAVMVGAGTVRADDPSLTVRDMGVDRQPVRVVVSRQMDLPTDCTLTRTARDIPVWVCNAASDTQVAPWVDAGAVSLPCAVTDGQIDVTSALAALAQNGLTRVFCEGGGALAASLLQADCVDELVVFTAGMGIGAEGLAGLGPMGISHLSDAPRFDLIEVTPVGADIMSRWQRR